MAQWRKRGNDKRVPALTSILPQLVAAHDEEFDRNVWPKGRSKKF